MHQIKNYYQKENKMVDEHPGYIIVVPRMGASKQRMLGLIDVLTLRKVPSLG